MWLLGLLRSATAACMVVAPATVVAAQTAAARAERADVPWSPQSNITVGGEVRQQYERFVNEAWGAGPPDRDGYLLQRYMFHADLRIGTRVRLFGQLKSGIETGRTGGPRPADEDRLDVHQGYADVTLSGRPSTSGIKIRIGRQEFNLGSARLVSVREVPNVRQSFDAVRATVRVSAWHTDVFISRPVTTSTGTFDDQGDRLRTLWGVYAVRAKGARGLDLYYLGYDRRNARFDQGMGHEKRHSIGARAWGQVGPVDHNVEVVGQWGTFGQDEIHAWTIASDTGYRVRLAGGPRLGIRADVTSGDADRADHRLGTFNPLFPKGAYFGLIAPMGPLNHMDIDPMATFTVRRGLTLNANWLFFWRTRRDDGLYGVPGNLLRSGRGTGARFVGHSPGLEVRWQRDRHLSLTADIAVFTAGAFLRQAPPAKTTTYFSAWSTYKF